jgi:hypothetical protein
VNGKTSVWAQPTAPLLQHMRLCSPEPTASLGHIRATCPVSPTQHLVMRVMGAYNSLCVLRLVTVEIPVVVSQVIAHVPADSVSPLVVALNFPDYVEVNDNHDAVSAALAFTPALGNITFLSWLDLGNLRPGPSRSARQLLVSVNRPLRSNATVPVSLALTPGMLRAARDGTPVVVPSGPLFTYTNTVPLCASALCMVCTWAAPHVCSRCVDRPGSTGRLWNGQCLLRPPTWSVTITAAPSSPFPAGAVRAQQPRVTFEAWVVPSPGADRIAVIAGMLGADHSRLVGITCLWNGAPVGAAGLCSSPLELPDGCVVVVRPDWVGGVGGVGVWGWGGVG